MIVPTIGRIVWFTPGQVFDGAFHDKKQPLAAIITYVWSDSMVNLAIFDQNGGIHSCTRVTLVQNDDEKTDGYYCEWMPYQKGQAAKAEALEKELKDAAN